MTNKWERRDHKRTKRKSSNFKIRDYDFHEKESAKKVSQQKRAWAALAKDEIDYFDDDEDYTEYN